MLYPTELRARSSGASLKSYLVCVKSHRIYHAWNTLIGKTHLASPIIEDESNVVTAVASCTGG